MIKPTHTAIAVKRLKKVRGVIGILLSDTHLIVVTTEFHDLDWSALVDIEGSMFPNIEILVRASQGRELNSMCLSNNTTVVYEK